MSDALAPGPDDAAALREQGWDDTEIAKHIPPPPGPNLARLLELAAEYLYLGNGDSHIRFAVAVAVSSALDGDPLWGQIVGAPSGGKTEAIDLLNDVVQDHVDDLTGPALLSWSKGKNPRPTGILSRNASRSFVTIGDFSTVLATSDRGGRDQLFALLRRAYDGSVSRDVGNMEPLRWTGRLTLLAGVTPAIDNYTSHTDALGPRWLYCRLPESDSESKRAAARKRRNSVDFKQRQKDAAAYAAELVREARGLVRAIDLSDEVYEAIEDAAIVTCYGRADVPRNPYGRREVEGLPTIEEPPRLVHQLEALAKSLKALGEPDEFATAICRQCALDTIPRPRMAALAELSLGEELTVAELHRRTGLHKHVARRTAEDLQVVGLAACPVEEESEFDEPQHGVPRPWRLAGEYGALAVKVCKANRDDRRNLRVTGG